MVFKKYPPRRIHLPPNPCLSRHPAPATPMHVFGPSNLFPYHRDTTYKPVDAPQENLRALGLLGFEVVIVQATCHGIDNSATLDAIATSNGRWRVWPSSTRPFQNGILRHYTRAGSAGSGSVSSRHLSGPPNFDRVHRIAEKIEGLGWHLVIYIEAEDIVEFNADLRKFKLPIVFDHMVR